MSLKPQWANGPAFAEIAEALDLATSDILAAWSTDEEVTITALFTRDYTDLCASPVSSSYIRTARFERDADGILRLFGEEVETDLTVGSMFK
jgi:hypothetical protein